MSGLTNLNAIAESLRLNCAKGQKIADLFLDDLVSVYELIGVVDTLKKLVDQIHEDLNAYKEKRPQRKKRPDREDIYSFAQERERLAASYSILQDVLDTSQTKGLLENVPDINGIIPSDSKDQAFPAHQILQQALHGTLNSLHALSLCVDKATTQALKKRFLIERDDSVTIKIPPAEFYKFIGMSQKDFMNALNNIQPDREEDDLED